MCYSKSYTMLKVSVPTLYLVCILSLSLAEDSRKRSTLACRYFFGRPLHVILLNGSFKRQSKLKMLLNQNDLRILAAYVSKYAHFYSGTCNNLHLRGIRSSSLLCAVVLGSRLAWVYILSGFLSPSRSEHNSHICAARIGQFSVITIDIPRNHLSTSL